MIKRFDRIDVATTDLNDAASIYEKNFGFKVTRSGEHASVTIGGAEIGSHPACLPPMPSRRMEKGCSRCGWRQKISIRLSHR